MWLRGWFAASHALPIFPFYTITAPFSPPEVLRISIAWGERFAADAQIKCRLKQPLPLPSYSILLSTASMHLGVFSSDLFREHPVGKSFNAVLYQLQRHSAIMRVTVFGVLPEQRHTHTVGNETYVDLFGKHCDEQAIIINSRRIDVLVELNGQTQNMRLDTLSHQPARLQVQCSC
jgi:predicted O-linked N-acetylglucosamine transferase (SPINDLY family)